MKFASIWRILLNSRRSLPKSDNKYNNDIERQILLDDRQIKRDCRESELNNFVVEIPDFN
jgi:hypothetical protein